MASFGAEKKHAAVNASAIRGEAGTGYEGENGLGEFECANCKYFGENDGRGDDGCDQRDMKKKSKLKRTQDGRPIVEEEGCCEYVWRIGKIEEEESK